MTKRRRNWGEKLFIGTSGWSYAHWRDGVFYPKGLSSYKQFEFYTQHFKTVEINSTFYRLPKVESLKRWAKIAPEGFKFVAKLNRVVTHYSKLKDCADRLYENKVIADGLGDKLAVILVQLPPSLHADHKLLKDFLALTKKKEGSWLPKLAFEFRNESWLTEETYKILTDYHATICLADWKGCEPERPNDVDFVYIRRHGPAGRYRGCYTKTHLKKDAKMIEKFLQEDKEVYVFFNNDIEGFAVRNAKELIELLS